MTITANIHEVDDNVNNTIKSVSTGSMSPEGAIESLRSMGVECYVTTEGNLCMRYWQIQENFVSREQAAAIRIGQPIPDQVDSLEWLSNNLQNIQRTHAGQWIAIYRNEIVASSVNPSEIMNQITEYDKPLVTFIPAEPVVWNFTYAV